MLRKMKFPIQSSRFVPWSSRKAPWKVSGSSCSSAMDSLPFPPARPRRQPRLQALLSRCSCASGKVQMLIFFFFFTSWPSLLPSPQLWQRRLQLHARHLPERPGGWQGMKGSCKAKLGWLGLDAASGGVGSGSRFFFPLLPPCLFVLDVPANCALCRWASTLAATQACSAGAGREIGWIHSL